MLLIKEGLIYSMEDEKLFYGDILCDEGKIKEIADHISDSGQMQVIDAKGHLVLPGFIDAHSHIGIQEEKNSKQGDDCCKCQYKNVGFVENKHVRKTTCLFSTFLVFLSQVLHLVFDSVRWSIDIYYGTMVQ